MTASSDALAARLGLRVAVWQAPMAGSQGAALAAAVSRAGALGAIPGAMATPEGLRAEVAAFRAAAGPEAPLNLNFFCHAPPVADASRAEAQRAALAPWYAELGLDASAVPAGAARVPFDDAMAQGVEALRPRVASFHFGLPPAGLLARVKATGALVASSATTVDEARWLAAQGADVVIVQGLEAGGHRGHFLRPGLDGQSPLRELLPAVVAALPPGLPVVAAGGLVDAADVAAALAAGAAGVQAGTAFLRAPEATTSAVHRAALARAGDLSDPHAAETAVTNLFTGRPARGLMNRLMRTVGPLRDDWPAFPLAANAIAPVRAALEAAGRGDASPLWAGTAVARTPARSAAEVVAALAAGFGR